MINKTYYISPSTVPSRTANSIHVMNMTASLSKISKEVLLFCKLEKNKITVKVLEDFYGLNLMNLKLNSIPSFINRGIEFFIALNAVKVFLNDLISKKKPEIIISRNLYASYILGCCFRNKIVYETHSPENGFRGILQNKLLNSSFVKTIVISYALKNILIKTHNLDMHNKIKVLHDSARDGIKLIDRNEKRLLREKLFSKKNIKLNNFNFICGYFGHLYEGRGIDIIIETAKITSDHYFIIFGGNDDQIEYFKRKHNCKNIIFAGFIKPKDVHAYMQIMDILLMPYQDRVSIGLSGTDTSKWMSPMKLFEYMSSGIPLVSSDLPVLKEVLEHSKNCLLVNPSKPKEWSDAISLYNNDHHLYEKVRLNAFREYREKYTWDVRVKKIISFAKFG